MSKKVSEATTVIAPVAEVTLGGYKVRLCEADLHCIFDAHSEGSADEMPSFLDEIIDLLIAYGCEKDGVCDAGHIIAHMGVLQRVKKLYRVLSDIDIKSNE